MTWTVERHGGNTRGAGSKWRLVANGSEAECREVFKNHKETMRQGIVKLNDGDGNLVDQATAYRVRTRW
jgi:hypothetical protein